MREEFQAKFDKLLFRKSNSPCYINDHRYRDFIKELKEVKNKLNKSFEDYTFLASYDVLDVNGRERLIRPKEGNTIKFYVKTDELFGILHTIHLLFNHANVEEMDEQIRRKYCNVSKDAIKLYITCCKRCVGNRIKL